MKKILFSLFLFSLFLLPVATNAYTVKADDFIYVAKDEAIDGNLYFKAQSLTIEGVIEGDVIGIAPNIQINGEIRGDLISIGQNTVINGSVLGNVRTVSNNLTINGLIEKNVNVLGESIILGESSHIKKDVLVKGINGEIRGTVGGSVHGELVNSLISGEIQEDVKLKMDKTEQRKYISSLTIEESAIVLGNLNYRAGNVAKITSENIKGEIKREAPQKRIKKMNDFSRSIYLIFSSLLIAILLNLLFKKRIEKTKKIIAEKNTKLGLPGTIILFLSPVAGILVFLTIIGIPIAIASLFLWLIALFLSRIIVAIFLGDYIFYLLKKEKASQMTKTFVGVTISFMLFALPFIGWLFSFLATIMGLGAIYFLFKKEKNENKSINL
jgi:hypothetical protein